MVVTGHRKEPDLSIHDWVQEMRSRQQRVGTRGQFDEIVGACRLRVTDEQWVDMWDVPLVPSNEELSGLKARTPRKLKLQRPPSKPAECVGFDALGRVVLVEDWHSLALEQGEDLVACECRLHDGPSTEIIQFSHRRNPERPAIKWLEWEAGKPRRLVRERRLAFRGLHLTACEERYEWSGGAYPQPMRQTSWSAEWKVPERAAADGSGEPVLLDFTTSEETYEYDEEGLLKVNGVLTDTWPVRPREMGYRQPGESFIAYRRLPQGVKFKDVESKLEERLTLAAVERLSEIKPGEPVYGVLVVYTREGTVVPPFLAVGLESFMREVVDRLGKRASEELWIPSSLIEGVGCVPSIDLDDDPEVRELCDLYTQFIEAKRDIEPAVRLCRRVAKRLMEHDWSGVLRTTDDFIIRADDLDGEDDPVKNLKASVPKELVQRLRKAGLH